MEKRTQENQEDAQTEQNPSGKKYMYTFYKGYNYTVADNEPCWFIIYIFHAGQLA